MARSFVAMRIPWIALLLSVTLHGEVSADILVRIPFGEDAARYSALSDELKQTTRASVTAVSSKPARRVEKSPSQGLTERLKAAEEAYRTLELDAAIERLKGADAECVRTVSYEGCRSFLFEAAIIRGMAYLALKRTFEADFEFQSAHIASPSSVLNPKKYAPNVLRAFFAACAEFETLIKAEVHLRPHPQEAALFVDGNPVEKAWALLVPGRHFIEADLMGFEPEWAIVEVDPRGKASPEEVALVLRPEDDVTAWSALITAVSADDFSPSNPGMDALLARFHIDAVLMVDPGENLGNPNLNRTVRLARSGKKDLSELPSIAVDAPLSAPFKEALIASLNLATASKTAEIQGPLPPSVGRGAAAQDAATTTFDGESDDDADSSLDEEDEDPALQFDASEEPSKTSPEKKKNIFKSPWLWISVGAVAAIVTGVVIAVKVQD